MARRRRAGAPVAAIVPRFLFHRPRDGIVEEIEAGDCLIAGTNRRENSHVNERILAEFDEADTYLLDAVLLDDAN